MRLLGILLMYFLNTTAYEGAGVQIFKEEHTLMVQGARSGRWGFPKGHREPFDSTWRATAVREVFEETGFQEGVNFEICDEDIIRHWGTRLYWTGRIIQDRIPIINKTEHRAVEWVPLEDLDNRRVTRDVEEWVLDGMPIECD
jgi:8-oxo-dGTP pyrophosphatase MutT (NUDIX family)